MWFKQKQPEAISSEANEGRNFSRRDILRIGAQVAGVAAAAGGVKYLSSLAVGERPSFAEGPVAPHETVGPPAGPAVVFGGPESTAVPTTEIAPPTTEAVPPTTEAEPSTTELLDPLADSLIPRERLVDGLKIGDIAATNPNGETVITVPLILDLDPNKPALDADGKQLYSHGKPMTNYDAQLLRGAVLEVRKTAVNPQNVYTEQALPGEAGDVFIFGHRMTQIRPDFDGDGHPDDVPEQSVFRRLHELQVGATLTLTIDGKPVTYRMNEAVDQNGILVENPDGSQNIDGLTAVRAQNSEGKKRLKLVACHPPGSTSHRIVAHFDQIDA